MIFYQWNNLKRLNVQRLNVRASAAALPRVMVRGLDITECAPATNRHLPAHQRRHIASNHDPSYSTNDGQSDSRHPVDACGDMQMTSPWTCPSLNGS
jgi:hypothetical protein